MVPARAKTSERPLGVSRSELFRLIVELAGSLIVVLAPDGTLLETNPEAERALGYRRDEVLGRPYTMLVPDDHLAEVAAQVQAVLEGHTVQGFETELLAKSGERVAVLWNARRAQDSDGQVKGLVAIGQDITKKKELESELLERDRLAAVGTLAAVLAHEVGNPLNNMFLHAQVLERRLDREGASDAARATLANVLAEIGRLNQLLAEFRSLSRRQSFERRSTSLGELFSQVLVAAAARHEQQNIQVVQELDEDLPPVVLDWEKMKQVLINLCNNAADAMPQGGTLTLAARAEGAMLVIDVSDTGAGIPDELQVFEPFATTKEAGTGLGLSIARQIVAGHDGSMSYDSTLGEGTTFRIVMPLEPKP